MKKSDSKFSIQGRLKSFRYAFNGLRILINEEQNLRIQLILAILVIGAGFILNIEYTEWLAIIFCIGLVLTTEAINSAIERICDIVNPAKNENIKTIKDMSAAAVFISSVVAVIVGLVVFIPKL